MAMAEELGSLAVKIALDSSGFQQGIGKINQSLKVLDSEFKANTSALGTNAKGIEGLKLKSEMLSKSMELQKQKVAALESAYIKSAESKGKDVKATQDLEIKLNNAKTELSKMGNELDSVNKKIDKQSSLWGRFSKELGDKVKDIGKTLSVSLTAPIAGAGAASVKLASDYNESINKVDVAFADSAQQVKDWAGTSLKSFGKAKGKRWIWRRLW
jgi:phage-related minor tail protein